ncbi:MAG: hypothetical protein M9958_00365 [Chitinophagales bacterium]|nr:hypothetical protein [Chitinophagales bacterium]
MPEINIQISLLVSQWISTTCTYMNIHRGLIIGKSNNEKANETREMMWLILLEQGWSYRQIGLYFYRSHPAIHSGIKNIRGILETDPQARQIYLSIQLFFQNIFQP